MMGGFSSENPLNWIVLAVILIVVVLPLTWGVVRLFSRSGAAAWAAVKVAIALIVVVVLWHSWLSPDARAIASVRRDRDFIAAVLDLSTRSDRAEHDGCRDSADTFADIDPGQADDVAAHARQLLRARGFEVTTTRDQPGTLAVTGRRPGHRVIVYVYDHDVQAYVQIAVDTGCRTNR